MPEKLTQRPKGAKEKACARPVPESGTTPSCGPLAALVEKFPEFGWLGERLLGVGIYRLMAARALVEFGGCDLHGSEVAAALGIGGGLDEQRTVVPPDAVAESAVSSAKRDVQATPSSAAMGNGPCEASAAVVEAACATTCSSGSGARDSACTEVRGVEETRVAVAQAMVDHGHFAPFDTAVRNALGIGSEADQEKAIALDVARRSKRKAGQPPPRKTLDERRAYVAVRILCAFHARLHAPFPTLRDGTRVDAAAAALLAQAGLVTTPGLDAVIEAHPRARRRAIEVPDERTAQRLARELESLVRGEQLDPDESERPLPQGMCGATMRNRRRRDDARSQYEEQRRYARMQRLERQAGAAGNRVNNPAGVKRLPLAEGRKARAVAWDRLAALKFLMSVPHALRTRLYYAGTNGGRRGRFSAHAMLVYACYAYLLWQSEGPRPAMRREGFYRAVEGLNREALAVAFVWNPDTREPYHPNTLSNLVELLELAGLMARETPNSQDDVYTGVTGWALNVYRLRNAEQLDELLRALGVEAQPLLDAAAVGDAALEAPS